MQAPKIGPDDPRYRAVVDKRFNKRFAARPDYVQLVASTEQVESALSKAVSAGRRVVVTSGGHCLEGFVAEPDVRIIIDISSMKRVSFAPDRRAVAIEAGGRWRLSRVSGAMGHAHTARRVSWRQDRRPRGGRRVRVSVSATWGLIQRAPKSW
jgi:hypothetical protein